MTDDTAKKNVTGLRRVLRAKAEEQARGVVSSNPPSEDVDWSKAPPWARAEARSAFEGTVTGLSKERMLQQTVMAAAEAAGVKVIRFSPPNSPEAIAAFAAAPNTGPSAAELWARRHLGQPYQPIGQPPIPTTEQLREAIARHERTPRDTFDVFLACADAETVYDFSSETKMDGDRFVITVTATPRTT